MNFFYNQDRARFKTALLVCGFILSIIAVVIIMDIFLMSCNYLEKFRERGEYMMNSQQLYNLLCYVNLGALCCILFGSISAYIRLRQGGKSIVDMLNATPIDAASQDLKHQQLINVVQEISIAAGVSAPMLYVLDKEQGINAFVAGYNPNDTVLVVTQGALDNLSRDELQGVIAHEYSHIFNSDTTLNLRLMVVLGGLLAMTQTGYAIMRASGRNKSRGIGMMLAFFGYMAWICGSILRAAISRQRESLADASAVQYTRDPNGIAIALLKIEQQGKDALLQNDRASEVNHMCFSRASIMSMGDVFASHPPLADRIAVLDQDGSIRDAFAHGVSKPSIQQAAKPVNKPLSAAIVPVLASIGNPTAEHFSQAVATVQSIPPELKQMLATQESAQALIFAMILKQHDDEDARLLNISQKVKELIATCLTFDHITDKKYRGVLVDLAIPVLKSMDAADVEAFMINVFKLVHVGADVNMFEAILITILSQRLHANSFQNIKPKYATFNSVQNAISCILWFLSLQGSSLAEEQQKAYQVGIQHLDDKTAAVLNAISFSIQDLITNLMQLRFMTPSLKQQFLQACIIIITQDGIVADSAAAELLRAICSCLDCPMPPLST